MVKKLCIEKSLTSQYVHIRVNGNNVQSINTKLAAIKYRFNQEIQFLYRKKQDGNEQLYKLHTIVNTNTRTTSMSLIKIYLKFHKNTPTCFGHSTIIREFFSSSLKSLLSTTLWIFLYILETGDVAACRVMCVELYLESA